MITYLRKAGTVDVSVVVRIIDSTDGTPELGVVAATAGLVLEYRRELEAEVSLATITDLAALTTAHTDKGMLHIGDGYYRVDLPDAACATGQVGVLVHGVATGMVVIGCYLQLVTFDPFDTVRLGLTALPNAAADAAGGLPISDAGGLDLDAKLAATNEVTAARMGALTDWINGGRLDLILDIIAADTTTDIPAILGTPAGASLAADLAAIEAQTDDIGTAGAGLTAVPWNAAWDAEVESEVNDAINTAIAELGVAAPTATPTLRTGMMLMYMALRNQLKVQTSGVDAIEIYNDAGTKITSKAITDDGADYVEAKTV